MEEQRNAGLARDGRMGWAEGMEEAFHLIRKRGRTKWVTEWGKEGWRDGGERKKRSMDGKIEGWRRKSERGRRRKNVCQNGDSHSKREKKQEGSMTAKDDWLNRARKKPSRNILPFAFSPLVYLGFFLSFKFRCFVSVRLVAIAACPHLFFCIISLFFLIFILFLFLILIFIVILLFLLAFLRILRPFQFSSSSFPELEKPRGKTCENRIIVISNCRRSEPVQAFALNG